MSTPATRTLQWWPVAFACAALTVAMTVSPVTVAACAALGLLVWAACRGLTGAERTAVYWLLIVAIAARVLVIAVLFAASDPGHLTSFPFDGDGWFMKQRSIWIRNVWAGVPVTANQRAVAFASYGWTSYIYLLAYIQYLLSPAPYAVHLFNVICYVGAAVLLYRLVRGSYGSIAALCALLVILFLPTSFMWSVSALKESLYLLMLVLVPFGVLWLTRGSSAGRRVAGIGIVAAAALVLNTIRPGAALIVATALGLTAIGTFMTRRAHLLVLTFLLLPVVGYVALHRPSVQTRVIANLQTSASLHIGNVHTTGHGYKLLDQRFYSGDPLLSMTWPEAERFGLRALYAFIVVPLPWQLSSRDELMFLPQQMVWYLLVPLALWGVVEGCRRDVLVTWMFVGLICAGTAAIAPNEGNIGTMVRHRDGIVPFVACLSALGLVSVLSRAGLFASNGRGEAVPSLGPLPSIGPRPPIRAHAVTRAAASSVVVRNMRRLADGSMVCAAIIDLMRPTLASGGGCQNGGDAPVEDVLERVARRGIVVATVQRGSRHLAAAWRDSFAAAVVNPVRALESGDRLRLFGWILLVATLPVGVLARFGDPARPALFAWAVTLTCSLILITLARPLTRAWQERG
jgi:hypothetical protein